MNTDDIFASGRFFTGCNYWAGHAGMMMWRDWRPDLVELEFEALAANGLRVLRVFPLWPDFQPVTRIRGWAGHFAGWSEGNAECRMQNAEWGMRNGECGMHNAQCTMRKAGCGMHDG